MLFCYWRNGIYK